LFQEIEDIQGQIKERVSRIRSWSEDFEAIYRAAERRRKQVKGRVQEPMRDLGLVRWGYNFSEEEKTKLVDIVHLLMQDEEEEDLTAQASRVASLMEQARRDVRTCMVICAVLWALACRKQIVSLLREQAADSARDLLPSLQVIQAAAMIRSDLVESRESREALVEEMKGLYEAVDPEERVGILLGIGYVLYHAWKLEKAAETPRPEWAEMSFRVGEEAVEALPAGELARAFALNHCTYVGIVTGVEPEKTDDYYGKLLELENTGVWHHRFDDTVGFYYLAQIKEQWEETPVDRRGALDLEADLSRAEQYFQKAKAEEVGDIDVDPHINELERIKRAYRRAREKRARKA
jgi:hypothetical protein